MYCVVLILFIVCSQQTLAEAPDDIEHEIDSLKHQILRELQNPDDSPDDSPHNLDNYDYADQSNRTITLNTKPDQVKQITKSTNSGYVPTMNPGKVNFPRAMTSKKPLEIFYRKALFDTYEKRNTENPWIHCLDLIAPYIYGYKEEINLANYRNDHPTVVRVLHLLSRNTTKYTEEDLKATLRHISKLQIHLFKWSLSSINQLIDVITCGGAHTFKELKKCMKHIFSKWRLDLSNVDILLKEMRIFRPPCLPVTKTEGSTKHLKVMTFKKAPDTPSVCRKAGGGEIECEITTPLS